MVKKKLRLRGWDLSGEIRAEILRNLVLISCKTVGWRPNWCQKGVILGPLVFRGQLAHPWAPGVGGSQTLKPRSKKVDFANYFIGFALQRGGVGGSQTLKPEA